MLSTSWKSSYLEQRINGVTDYSLMILSNSFCSDESNSNIQQISVLSDLRNSKFYQTDSYKLERKIDCITCIPDSLAIENMCITSPNTSVVLPVWNIQHTPNATSIYYKDISSSGKQPCVEKFQNKQVGKVSWRGQNRDLFCENWRTMRRILSDWRFSTEPVQTMLTSERTNLQWHITYRQFPGT